MTAAKEESLQELLKRGQEKMSVIQKRIENYQDQVCQFDKEENNIKEKINTAFDHISNIIQERRNTCIKKITDLFQPTFDKLRYTINFLTDQLKVLNTLCEESKQPRTLSYSVETIEMEIHRINLEVSDQKWRFHSILCNDTELEPVKMPVINFHVDSKIYHSLEKYGIISLDHPIVTKEIGQNMKEITLDPVFTIDSRSLQLAIFQPSTMDIRKDRIYVVNDYDKTICVISTQGRLIKTIGFSQFIHEDNSLQDIAVNDRLIFISVWKKDCILAFDHNGNFDKEVLKLGRHVELKSPCSLSVTSTQQLVVADKRNKRIIVCLPDLSNATSAIANTNINNILKLTVTKEDNILIANDGNSDYNGVNFQLYNLKGQLLYLISPNVNHSVQGLDVSLLKHIIISCGQGNAVYIYSLNQPRSLQLPLAKATAVRYIYEKYLFVSCANRILVYDFKSILS